MFEGFEPLDIDEGDMHQRLRTPILVLWGERGFVGRKYDLLAVWRERAEDVRGHRLPCGHYLPEESPDGTLEALRTFFSA